MRSCRHVVPELRRLGYACSQCDPGRGPGHGNPAFPEDPRAPRSEPRAGFGQLPEGVRRLTEHLIRLSALYPDFVPPRLNFVPTIAQADELAAQWEAYARQAYPARTPSGTPLTDLVRHRARAQLEDLRLAEKERSLLSQQERLEREAQEQADRQAEAWKGVERGLQRVAAAEHRLAQRTDVTVLAGTVLTLLLTWGPPPTTEARFFVTLLVASATYFWFHGRYWINGQQVAWLATPAGRGWTVLRGGGARLVGAITRPEAASDGRLGVTESPR